MLSAVNVSKKYRKNTAVKEFSFDFVSGIYGLLGPNGAGKTSLINILAAASAPSAGEVRWRTQNIAKAGAGYYRHLGYLPQEDCIYPQLKAIDYLRYFAELKGLSRRSMDDRIDMLAEICNLKAHLDKKCGEFSGGMKRRLCLIQALLNDPKVLILDEPTSGLDPMERINLRNLISQLSKQRIVIYSTHIVPDIEQIAEQIIFLRSGEILASGYEDELLRGLSKMVWEISLDTREVDTLAKSCKIISVYNDQSHNAKVRFVSSRPIKNATQVNPRLEDLYVYLMEN